MPPSIAKPTAQHSDTELVEAFLVALEHPHKAMIRELQQLILSADQRIMEGIKWNTVSFKTTEYFATIHLRAKEGVQLILHLGAKKREQSTVVIDDPDGLLTWLGTDRASIPFRNQEYLHTKQVAFVSVIRQWIAYV